jgi:hypothetical protein
MKYELSLGLSIFGILLDIFYFYIFYKKNIFNNLNTSNIILIICLIIALIGKIFNIIMNNIINKIISKNKKENKQIFSVILAGCSIAISFLLYIFSGKEIDSGLAMLSSPFILGIFGMFIYSIYEILK